LPLIVYCVAEARRRR